MALVPRTARAALRRIAMALATALCACNGHQQVFSAVACSDPCCGGPDGIDCAEHPDIACVEPGDACSAIAYGCVKGSVYVDAAVPPSCSGSSDSTPVFTLPDAEAWSDGSPDATDAADDRAAPDGNADGAASDSAPSNVGADAAPQDAGPGDATLD